jgi:hypothetical protein
MGKIMVKKESFARNLLRIEVEEKKDSIVVSWSGKSVEREPGKFITPILVNVIRKSSGLDKKVILDFRALAYMNSSSITPVIKILERARRGRTQIRVVYRKSLKWQDLSFSALQIFRTKDRRVEIKGL